MRPNQGAGDRGRWWIEGLDAWRALAIIAVLIFHLRPGSLKGGFIGVDVFFVISGFLITTLLIRELAKNGKINLPQFWVRRARRLLPALFTVVITSTVLAYFAGGDLLVGIGRHVLGALTFSNNWLEIFAGADYFAASVPNLFMNFWSLAVEEQFYLLWPILAIILMAAIPRGKVKVAVLLSAAAISAVSMAVLYSPENITRVYYGTDTHGFGLLIGAALAFAMAAPEFTFFDSRRWQRLRTPLALGGFAVVITLMLTVDGEGAFAYRGGLVIASIATAAMVAALPGAPTRLTKVLTLAPIEWVGHRSYGIYMWHWPAILIVDAAWPATAPDSTSWWISRAVALTSTLTLAALSYTYIENPIRKDGFRATFSRMLAWFGRVTPRGRAVVGVASAVVASLFAVAMLTAPTESTLERSMQEAEEYINALQGGSQEQTDPPKSTPEQGSESDQPEPEPAPEPEPEPEPAPEPAPDPTLSPLVIAPDQIYTVGDSMLYVAAPGMARELPGIQVNAESNRQWPAVRDELKAAVAAEKIGPVVVIAAGTNAGARETDVLEEVIQLLGPERRIVLVNIYSSSTFVEKTNENYAAMASKYLNVAVADWHAAVLANPDHLQPDKIHPNFDGMFLWTKVVVEALTQLDVEIDLPEPEQG